MSRTMDLRQPIDLKLLGLLVRAAKYVIPDRFLQLCIAAMFMLAFHGFLSEVILLLCQLVTVLSPCN